MLRKRPILALLVVTITAMATASCGTPSGQDPGATPVDGSTAATGWFAYVPMSGTAEAPATPTHAPGGRTMTADRFWQIVDRAASPDPDAVAASLRDELSGLAPVEVLAFEAEFVTQMGRSNTFLHLAAAETVLGYVSEDVFVSFRTWVLAQGRAVYEAFVAGPDSLAAHGPDDEEQVAAAESVENVALDVWSQQTGRDPFADGSGVPDSGAVYSEPRGTALDDAQRAARFPRLTATYRGGSPTDGPAPVVRR